MSCAFVSGRAIFSYGPVAPLLSVLLLGACTKETGKLAGSSPDNRSDLNVTLAELSSARADAFEGKSITLAGEIEDIYGARAFSLGGDGWHGGEVRVITSTAVPSVSARSSGLFEKDDLALVTGSVRWLSATEFEQEVGSALDAKARAEISGSVPVVIANEIKITPRINVPGSPAGATLGLSGAETIYDARTVVAANAAERPRMVGRSVELENVTVQAVLQNKGVFVGPSPKEQIFVKFDDTPDSQAFQSNLQLGQHVNVNGVIKKVPSLQAMSSMWGLDAMTSRLLDRDLLYIDPDQLAVASPDTDANAQAR